MNLLHIRVDFLFELLLLLHISFGVLLDHLHVVTQLCVEVVDHSLHSNVLFLGISLQFHLLDSKVPHANTEIVHFLVESLHVTLCCGDSVFVFFLWQHVLGL